MLLAARKDDTNCCWPVWDSLAALELSYYSAYFTFTIDLHPQYVPSLHGAEILMLKCSFL
jgi:hypothetical protein